MSEKNKQKQACLNQDKIRARRRKKFNVVKLEARSAFNLFNVGFLERRGF